MRMFAAIAVACLAGSGSAQEMAKPGPEHEMLKKREGTWISTMKFNGAESKGSVTYKMEVGGMWLVGTLDSELFGQKFSGKSLDSYNAATKKYVSLWVDSVAAVPVIMEGTFDKAKKTMTLAGEGPGQDGKPMKYKSVTEVPDDDTAIMSMYMGDAKEPGFTVTYKRKK